MDFTKIQNFISPFTKNTTAKPYVSYARLYLCGEYMMLCAMHMYDVVLFRWLHWWFTWGLVGRLQAAGVPPWIHPMVGGIYVIPPADETWNNEHICRSVWDDSILHPCFLRTILRAHFKCQPYFKYGVILGGISSQRKCLLYLFV